MKYIAISCTLLVFLSNVVAAQWQKMSGSDSIHGVSMYLDDTVIVVATREGNVFRNVQDSMWHVAVVGPPRVPLHRMGYILDTLFLGTDSGLFVSSNTGQSWERGEGLPYGRTGSVHAFLEASFGQDPVTYVGSDSGAFRSTNGGNSWGTVFSDTSGPHRVEHFGHREVPSYVYSVIRYNSDSRIYRWLFGTLSFVRSDSGFNPSLRILSLYVGNEVTLAGSSGGIFRAIENGSQDSWDSVQDVGGGSGIVYDFLAIDNNIIAAGASDGFMLSSDGGASWRRMNEGLPADPDIRAVGRRGDTLYLCNANGGIWRCEIADLNPRSVTILASKTVLCGGDSTPLSLQTSMPAGSYHVRWSNGDTSDITVVRPDSTTTYSVDVRIGTEIVSASIQINVGISAEAGNDITICQGSKAQLGMTPTAGCLYYWEPDTGLSDPDSANPMASPDTTTLYILTVVDTSTGCESRDTVTVRVNAGPLARAGSDATICPRQRVPLGTTSISGYSYHWEPSESLSDADAANPMASPDTTTLYTLTVVDTQGCQSSDMVTITVHELPQAFIVRIAPDTLIAMPGGVQRWKRDTTIIAGAVDKLFIDTPGKYSVETIRPGGGAVWSPPRSITVNDVNDRLALPDISFAYGVIGYDKRAMLTITNDGAETLVLDSLKILPDDLTGCSPDTASFAVVNSIDGVTLAQGEAARVFIAFRPDAPGMKVVSMEVYYRSVGTGISAISKRRVAGLPVPQGNYLRDSITLEPMASVRPGDTVYLKFRVKDIVDADGSLAKRISDSGCALYTISFSAQSTLFFFDTSKFKIPDNCRISGRSLPKPQGQGHDLIIDYTGLFRPRLSGEDTFTVEFPFQAMLGDSEATWVTVLEFKWLGLESSARPYEAYGPRILFQLEGVCREGGHLRLVEPDIAYRPAAKMRLMPNPADQELSITYDLPSAGPVKLMLYDMHGSIVRSIDADGNKPGAATVAWNVAELPTGSYFVVLSTDGHRTIEKLDIAH